MTTATMAISSAGAAQSLVFDQVSIEYRAGGVPPVPAVQDVSLTIPRGQFVSLIGPSGCGKSTLLRAAGGLVPCARGAVLAGGRPVTGPRPDSTAIMFQNYGLYPWRTVRENAEMALEIRGVSAALRRERVRHYLELVGLKAYENFYPRQLSGGMQQRVALSRALSTEPELLLMDEPFGALDEQTRLVLGEELSRLVTADQRTILFVTHSLAEAVMLSDQIVVMTARPGRVKAVLTVAAPQPRTADFMLTREFEELRHELFRLLSGEIRLAAGLGGGRSG